MVESICVFCGSNPGRDPAFQQAAADLGAEMGRRGIRLVYGGSHLGMMGTVANAVLAAGGAVTGVVPRLLVEKEAAFTDLADLRVVATMHERKALMVDLAEGFVALPGGYGTLDELFECVTWAQLRIHVRPIVLWSVNGFFDPLFAYLDSVVEAGLLRPAHRALLRRAGSLDAVFELLHQPVADAGVEKWMPGTLR